MSLFAKLAAAAKVERLAEEKKETKTEDGGGKNEEDNDNDNVVAKEDGFIPDDLVTINVGGTNHDTSLETLMSVPKTRLWELAKSAQASGKRKFFFDRHPEIFSYIMNFYRVGKMHVPLNFCGPLVKEEMDFWKIDDKV